MTRSSARVSRFAAFSMFTLVTVHAPVALAGPINPPAGPVASTPGPEPRTPISAATTPGDADSVFRITSSGSYYLTGNLIAQTGKYGIEIGASNVVIDLQGFTLVGVASTLSAVTTDNTSRDGITVRNGVITGWSGAGVFLNGAGHTVEDVNIRTCGGIGIRILDLGIIRNCHVANAASTGIAANTNSTVSHCIASGCGGVGISVNGGAITGCTSSSNGGNGIQAGTARPFPNAPPRETPAADSPLAPPPLPDAPQTRTPRPASRAPIQSSPTASHNQTTARDSTLWNGPAWPGAALHSTTARASPSP